MINGAKLEDAGKITVKSNADQASADLGVKCKSRHVYKNSQPLILNVSIKDISQIGKKLIVV